MALLQTTDSGVEDYKPKKNPTLNDLLKILEIEAKEINYE
jgi:hypothetical protein